MIRKFKLNNKQVYFKIYNPGGNKTALVYENNYTKQDISTINNYILESYPQIEQVGFISKKDKYLMMAGGEFCVNATRSTIYEFLDGNDGEISISVSGTNDKINGWIKNNNVFVKMDFKNVINPISINSPNKALNAYIVKLEGIEHIIIDYSTSKNYITLTENKLKDFCKEILSNFESNEKAIGVIFLEKVNNTTKIYPIVWVRSIDTLYCETACGSGTIAAFTYLYNNNKNNTASILQPSGYYLDVEKENNLITISGPVIEE